jgi:hypothetical protein
MIKGAAVAASFYFKILGQGNCLYSFKVFTSISFIGR